MTDTSADFNLDSRFCPHCRHPLAVSGGRGDGGRESIWSVSPAWKTAFFSIFSVSTLITTIAIIAYQIANRGDAAIMETYRSTAELRRVATGVWTYPRRRSAEYNRRIPIANRVDAALAELYMTIRRGFGAGDLLDNRNVGDDNDTGKPPETETSGVARRAAAQRAATHGWTRGGTRRRADGRAHRGADRRTDRGAHGRARRVRRRVAGLERAPREGGGERRAVRRAAPQLRRVAADIQTSAAPPLGGAQWRIP